MVLVVKNPPSNADRYKFDPWVGKIPWRRAQKLTPVFLPREFHGQRSLGGRSPQGPKELDTTEATEHACTELATGEWRFASTQIAFLVPFTSSERFQIHLTKQKFYGLEDPLEKGMATHSSILAWRIPWTEQPGRLQSMELQRVRYD